VSGWLSLEAYAEQWRAAGDGDPYFSPEFLAAAAEARGRIERLMSVKGSEPVDAFHRRLGTLLWNDCGIVRSARGLEAAIQAIRALSEELWRSVRITGPSARPNSELEKALRMVDYLELGELMCRDALSRDESCGAHFRTEHQTPAGEALRNDADFAYVAAWQHAGDQEPILIREPLEFEAVTPVSRSYN
jgi:succinate dehydrogenase / fumarate reductase flavoprotein subunit